MITEVNFKDFRKAVKEAILEADQTGNTEHKFQFDGKSYLTKYAEHRCRL